MYRPGLTEILGVYALGILCYFGYIWTKRFGPMEWEKRLAPGNYQIRKGGMLVLSVVAFLVATYLGIEWVLDAIR